MDKSGYDFRFQRAEIDKEDIKIIFTILSPHNLYYNNKHKMLKHKILCSIIII
jgi:hypothetical protein